jgi:protein phosphatase 1L
LRDGTTAVCAVIQKGTAEDTLTIAHVGDSRGVLCRAGYAVAVTEDHKPDLESEKKRIEALGGFVSFIGCWRAMGILAMSRAIGDLFLKPYVSAEPDVTSMPLKDDAEFLVIASDGVFDVFDNDQVVQIVRSAENPEQAAQLLTNSAFAAGSLDNITAVVIALRGYKAGAEQFVPSPREELGHRRTTSLVLALRACALDYETAGYWRGRDWLQEMGAVCG